MKIILNKLPILLLSICITSSCTTEYITTTSYKYINNSNNQILIESIRSIQNDFSNNENYMINTGDNIHLSYDDMGNVTPPFNHVDSLIITINDSISHHFNHLNYSDEMNLLNIENYETGINDSGDVQYTYTFTD